jgi:hypothetical protein
VLYWWPDDDWQRGTVARLCTRPVFSRVVAYTRQTPASALRGTADSLLRLDSESESAAGGPGRLNPTAPGKWVLLRLRRACGAAPAPGPPMTLGLACVSSQPQDGPPAPEPPADSDGRPGLTRAEPLDAGTVP